jgi:hypothetical protein
MTMLSLADQVQQYQNCLVEYKTNPVYVHAIGSDGAIVEYLANGAREKVDFSLETFKPLSSRLGMVNISGSVVRITRCPVRRMNVGLNHNNIVLEALDVPYAKGSYQLLVEVNNLNCRALFSTITGKYPKFKDAIKKAISTKGACAWDRQFCVDKGGRIIYKNKKVGVVDLKAETPSQIIFDKPFSYLVSIVGEK